MVLGMFYGCGTGIIIGLTIGIFVFGSRLQKRSFARLDVAADFDDEIPDPLTGGKVSHKLMPILGFTDEWVKSPDYQRVTWFNFLLKTLWPHISKTARKEIKTQGDAAMVDVCKQVPMGILESIDIAVAELGEDPVRLGGIKVYESREDNLMTEGVLIFGSGMRLLLNIKVRIPGTGYAICVPIEMRDIQMRAVARITLSPIVETLPCVGGVSITLLKAPYFDAKFSLIGSLDILGLPFIHEAFKYGVQYVLNGLMVYPNKMDFPVMENFGKPPVPLGMLEVVIKSAEGLPNADFMGKSDPFVELSVQEGRMLRTRTIDNDLNPTWDQCFNLLVDDIDTQSLLLVVKDDDFGFEDDVLGVADIEFATAEFIKTPRVAQDFSIKLRPGDSLGNEADHTPGTKKVKKSGGEALVKTSKRPRKDAKLERIGRNGTLHLEVTYLPFVSPEEQEEAAKKLEEKRRKDMIGSRLQMAHSRMTRSFSEMRGVLTVTVHRCVNLEEKSGEVDSYVRMTLFDPSTGNTEAFRTSLQINDISPRFNQKFEFIDVPSDSHFTATVFDKSGFLESRLTLTPWKQKADVELGHVRLNVEEVARNKTMKDMWPLRGANKGDIQLTLAFQPIIFDMEDEEEVLGDETAPVQPTDGPPDSSSGGLPEDIFLSAKSQFSVSPRPKPTVIDNHGVELGASVGTAIGTSARQRSSALRGR